jgi:hypothetical protein
VGPVNPEWAGADDGGGKDSSDDIIQAASDIPGVLRGVSHCSNPAATAIMQWWMWLCIPGSHSIHESRASSLLRSCRES